MAGFHYDIDDLKAMLKPYDPALMEAYAVNRAVNSVKNDTEECIEPVAQLHLTKKIESAGTIIFVRWPGYLFFNFRTVFSMKSLFSAMLTLILLVGAATPGQKSVCL